MDLMLQPKRAVNTRQIPYQHLSDGNLSLIEKGILSLLMASERSSIIDKSFALLDFCHFCKFDEYAAVQESICTLVSFGYLERTEDNRYRLTKLASQRALNDAMEFGIQNLKTADVETTASATVATATPTTTTTATVTV